MTSNDQSREDFERWMRYGEDFDPRAEDSPFEFDERTGYKNQNIQAHYQTWKEALSTRPAAVDVEVLALEVLRQAQDESAEGGPPYERVLMLLRQAIAAQQWAGVSRRAQIHDDWVKQIAGMNGGKLIQVQFFYDDNTKYVCSQGSMLYELCRLLHGEPPPYAAAPQPAKDGQ